MNNWTQEEASPDSFENQMRHRFYCKLQPISSIPILFTISIPIHIVWPRKEISIQIHTVQPRDLFLSKVWSGNLFLIQILIETDDYTHPHRLT